MIVSEMMERARRFLTNRAAAYRRVFNLESQDVDLVLADLARFCRAHKPTTHANAAVAAHYDGRREVWLRIQHHLHLTDEVLWKLYNDPER